MSDFYICEHKAECCGTCIRAIKTEDNRLQKQIEKLLAVKKAVETLRGMLPQEATATESYLVRSGLLLALAACEGES